MFFGPTSRIRTAYIIAALMASFTGCDKEGSTQSGSATGSAQTSSQSSESLKTEGTTTIQTRIGPLEYELPLDVDGKTLGYPTDATVRMLYDEMDFQRAVLAHQISDNLVSYYSMQAGPQDAIDGAQMGDLIIWEKFLDTKGIVLTGNDTTVYGMVFMDLENNGPMVVEVPPSPFLGSVLDLWQVPLAGIDSGGATFVVAAEDEAGDIDVPEGARLLRSRTSLAVFFCQFAG